MDLDKYLKMNKMSNSGFAALCGLSNQAIHKILNGNDVQLSSILKIYKASNGAVGPFDLPYARKNMKNDEENIKQVLDKLMKENPKKFVSLLLKYASEHAEEEDKPDYAYETEDCEPS